MRFIFSIIAFFAITACAHKEIQPAAPAQPKPVKVAVVLGAGAAKGFAHIGVLKVLEANRVPVHMVVGTSAGSFVGSLYASGYSAYQLQKISFEVEQNDIADFIIPDNGFIKGDKLEAYVNRMVRNVPMEKLKIPFYAVATDIQTGKEMVFGRGNTGSAVRASCSIPGVFCPVNINGRVYVDGGVVSPVAVDVARRYGANVIIAIDVSGGAGESPQPAGTLDTIMQAVNIMYSKISQQQLPSADVVIKPNVGTFGSSDFARRHEAVLEGEKAAQEALPAILAAISAKQNAL